MLVLVLRVLVLALLPLQHPRLPLLLLFLLPSVRPPALVTRTVTGVTSPPLNPLSLPPVHRQLSLLAAAEQEDLPPLLLVPRLQLLLPLACLLLLQVTQRLLLWLQLPRLPLLLYHQPVLQLTMMVTGAFSPPR